MNSSSLSAKYQHFISEVVMLRLFSVLETSISECAFKLACGANYRSGVSPILLHNCRSMVDAHSNMLTMGRRRPAIYLKWTRADFIEYSIKNVLDTRDSFYRNISYHSLLIDEMRVVRNHIAHGTSSTRLDYYRVLTRLYGGNPRLMMGAFLTSKTRHTNPNIMRYIQVSKIIINDITAG
nr:hypothetical protein [Mariniflexile sp. KMM 9835]